MSRCLDEVQRLVLEVGVSLATSIVKSTTRNKISSAQELVVVQGGAGSGNHLVIKLLEELKFKQLVPTATHIKGRLIDLVFANNVEEDIVVSQNGQYFSDHDLITIY